MSNSVTEMKDNLSELHMNKDYLFKNYVVSDFNSEYIGIDVVTDSGEMFTFEADWSVKGYDCTLTPLSFDVNVDTEKDVEVVIESFDVYDSDGKFSYKLDEYYNEFELEAFLTKVLSDYIMIAQIMES